MRSTHPATRHLPPTARNHETVLRFRVKHADVGVTGFVDGGTLLEWIDTTGYAVAAGWSGRDCVTASACNIHLDRPISAGELVEIRADLVHTGRTSMHILITICSSDPTRAKSAQSGQCPIIFVAVDDTGRPVEVPPWTPVSMLELQRQRQARVRVLMRTRIEAAMAAENYAAVGAAPRATLRYRAAATDVNCGGRVHGGRVLRWMDEAAAVCGANWIGAHVISSYIVGIRCYRPITTGQLTEITARIIHTGPRSIHTGIYVFGTDPDSGETWLAAAGLVVMVSLDERGDARPVPTWEPDSDEDRRLDRHAKQLIELRQFNEPFTTAVRADTHPTYCHHNVIARRRREA